MQMKHYKYEYILRNIGLFTIFKSIIEYIHNFLLKKNILRQRNWVHFFIESHQYIECSTRQQLIVAFIVIYINAIHVVFIDKHVNSIY